MAEVRHVLMASRLEVKLIVPASRASCDSSHSSHQRRVVAAIRRAPRVAVFFASVHRRAEDSRLMSLVKWATLLVYDYRRGGLRAFEQFRIVDLFLLTVVCLCEMCP